MYVCVKGAQFTVSWEHPLSLPVMVPPTGAEGTSQEQTWAPHLPPPLLLHLGWEFYQDSFLLCVWGQGVGKNRRVSEGTQEQRCCEILLI